MFLYPTFFAGAAVFALELVGDEESDGDVPGMAAAAAAARAALSNTPSCSFSLSRPSEVSGSPLVPPAALDGRSVTGVVGVPPPLVVDGLGLLVDGACTAIESAALLAVVAREVVLPVLNTEAARRGRPGKPLVEGLFVADPDDEVLLLVEDDADGLLMLSLATSWFREGGRFEDGLLAIGMVDLWVRDCGR
jgi:hypothetical protein